MQSLTNQNRVLHNKYNWFCIHYSHSWPNHRRRSLFSRQIHQECAEWRVWVSLIYFDSDICQPLWRSLHWLVLSSLNNLYDSNALCRETVEGMQILIKPSQSLLCCQATRRNLAWRWTAGLKMKTPIWPQPLCECLFQLYKLS